MSVGTPGTPLNESEVREFLFGNRLFAIDPKTRKIVAEVTYESSGRCYAQFVTGDSDTGQWGLDGAYYWTRYTKFREGARSEFYLEWLGDGIAQAYHRDGTRAFIQALHAAMP